MHYLFLILALVSSFSIALLMRVFEHKHGNRTVIIAGNYIIAGSTALIFSGKLLADISLYYFGAILGLFFFVAFLTFSKAIKTKGIAGAVTMGRLSLAVPVTLSIFLWGEKPLLLEIIGLIIIFAIILTWEDKLGTLSPILIALFLLFGSIDASVKFFKLKFPAVDDNSFLIIVFYSAMVWSWLYVLISGQKVKTVDIGRGLLLGLPNYFSTFFLMKALETIPAFIAFPFVNIGIIILSALVGYFIFKEKLSMKRSLLICLGIMAVLFLTT